MKKKQTEDIEWLEFDLLSDIPELVHGVFLRQEGLFPNKECIQRALKIDRLISVHQVHGNAVEVVSVQIPPCDGIITQEKNVGLIINHADCQAALFYDPIQRVIGNIHSGWRGNVLNIYAQAIAKMHAQYGTNPADLLVCISPSLGPNWAEFKNYKQEFPEHFWRFQIKPDYFDLWGVARMQLEECGVLPHHIEIASICTHSHPKEWYSYRRDKTKGRNGTVLALL